MANTVSLVEDYATTPVPEQATYSGWRIGFVLGGIGVALPALLSGAEVGLALGYQQSTLAFIVAGLLVTALAFVTGWVGMRSRLSTYMILQFSFGRVGARAVNLTFALAQFGWFGVNAYFFGTAAESVGDTALGISLPSWTYILVGGVLMTIATIFGFKALDKLAWFAFPLMLTVLAVMIAKTFGTTDYSALAALPATGDITFGQAITVLAGGIIVGVLLVPDLTRYARAPRDVAIAVLIALAIIEPLVHVAASGPALIFQELDPLALMLAMGLGSLAFIFLVFASVSTNAVNLYGAGLSLTSIFPRVPEWMFVVVAGTVGTGLAVLEISELFLDFLIWQSVIFSSVLGIYVVDFFVVKGAHYDLADLERAPPISWQAFVAWGVGALVAAATFTELFSITTMSNLDGVIVAALLYGALMRTPMTRPTVRDI
ncbi:MAG: cytosine permease [Pseudomonadota bacterium]